MEHKQPPQRSLLWCLGQVLAQSPQKQHWTEDTVTDIDVSSFTLLSVTQWKDTGLNPWRFPHTQETWSYASLIEANKSALLMQHAWEDSDSKQPSEMTLTSITLL